MKWTKFGKKEGALVLVFFVAMSFFTFTPDRVYADDEFDFRSENGGTSIFDYNGDGGNAFIPSTLGGFPVTRIEEFAFYAKGLEYVQIADSVTVIDHNAFADNQIYGVDLGKNLTIIGNEAFYQNVITSIIIPESVTLIGEFAFFRNQLMKVIIPPSVTDIGIAAFEQNNGGGKNFTIYGVSGSAAEIYAVANQHTFIPLIYSGDYVYTIVDGKASIILYRGSGGDEQIPISLDGYPVVGIEDSAFKKSGLTSIVIPDSVTRIGNGAFAFNNDLTWVIIGQNVAHIGDYAFIDNQLSDLIIPDSVLSIGDGSFDSNVLQRVEIGSRVESIGKYAFMNNQLTAIEVPRSVSIIGPSAFQMNALTSVMIRNRQANIGESQFEGNNPNYKDITISGIVGSTAETYASENGHNFIPIDETEDDAASEMNTLFYGFGFMLLAGGAFTLRNRRNIGVAGSHTK